MRDTRTSLVGFWVVVTFVLATKILVFLLQPEADPGAMWGPML